MTAMKQIVEIEQQFLRVTYMMLNQDLCIQEVYLDQIGLFHSSNIVLQGRHIETVINKEYLELVSIIEVERSEKTPSLYKLSTELNDEYEVEILPFGKNIIVFFKCRINENIINETDKELESKYNKLSSAKELADRANREKTDLLLLLGHEVRTPLNSINGFLQLLMSNSEQLFTKDQQNRLLKIRNASKQIEEIMNDALDFVRLNQIKMRVKTENIDIYGLIEDCIQAQSLESSVKNIKVIHQKGDTKVSILSDSNRLTQVLMNILSNAVKYTNEGGYIHISSIKYEQKLLIEIIDSGVGIQEKELAFIFSPYYRSSSSDSMSTGIGIGLSLVKHILTELGGTIHVTSELGVGSRFIIELPIWINK